jgi:DNA invertase Pin-like site-specific DNA recombinase
MVFTVLGAVAELERSLIVERVKAGLRNARVKGKKLGRPRATIDTTKVTALRREGQSWRHIAEQMGVSAGTLFGRMGRISCCGGSLTADESSSEAHVKVE